MLYIKHEFSIAKKVRSFYCGYCASLYRGKSTSLIVWKKLKLNTVEKARDNYCGGSTSPVPWKKRESITMNKHQFFLKETQVYFCRKSARLYC